MYPAAKEYSGCGEMALNKRIDWVRVGGLQSGVRLKTKPRGVVGADVVVDAGRLHLFVVVAGVRNASAGSRSRSRLQDCPKLELPSALKGHPSTASGVPLVFPYSENIF